MKAREVKGMDLLQYFDFPTYACIYMDFSRMKYVLALIAYLLEAFCFNNKFSHSSENRCVCIHRKLTVPKQKYD